MSYRHILFLTILFLYFSVSNVFGLHQSSQTADSLHVISYDIHLDITDFTYNTISGYTIVKVNPKVSGINKILLDLLSLHVDSVKYYGALHPFLYDDTLLALPLPSAIGTSDTIDITVYYHGAPVADSYWGGFSFSGGTAYNLGVAFVAVPHCFGRVWFPCIDDFKDRSFYSCHITTPSDKMAVCGGTLLSSTPNGNGTITWNWKLSSPVPTYLASVAVSNYTAYTDVYHGIERDIPIAIYVAPQDTAKARASFIHLKNILSIFEQHFGPYLWERVGYVGVPFNGGAMEHATNIAYPNACITGDLSYEDLYAHELSHHWFGDLATCYRAEEMWLNEGWARFCELFYTEALYGKENYKNGIRSNHRKVIQFNHIEDGSYLALSDIPMQVTYGSTVYDKGADVVHSLRNYMGDGQFFRNVKLYLDSNRFTDVSIAKLGSFLQRHSGQNINGFFADWVYQPGFVHYSIDSFPVRNDSSTITARVYIRQRTLGGSALHTNDSLEITFMDNGWHSFTRKIAISGAFSSNEIEIPFVPTIAIADLEEKVSDATTDCYKTIKATGLKTFDNTQFTMDVQSVTDSAFVRVEHSLVAPDYTLADSSIYRISDYRYWKIDGIFPNGFSAKGRFNYNRSKPTYISSSTQGWLDHGLLLTTGSADSLVLLYRRNTSEKWRICNFTKTGGSISGYLTAVHLTPGEYTLGIGKPNLSNIEPSQGKESGLLIYPNPARQEVHIAYGLSFTNAVIYDNNGRMVENIRLKPGEKSFTWYAANRGGTFIVKVTNGEKYLCSGRFIMSQ